MKIGDRAPDFELQDETGATRRLSEMLPDGPVVLFFYPAALTPGCTKESCHFRDLATEFKEVGAQRVGISADAVEKQKKFSDRYDFDFPLLSDPDRTVAEAYGVKRGGVAILGKVKRSTFVIGRDDLIKDVISSELNMNSHADQALATLRQA